MTATAYHRPRTRGALRDKLVEGVSCEVVLTSVTFTMILLKGWLEFSAFTVRLSENEGWSVFEPDN